MSVKTDTPNVATAVSAVEVRQGEEGAFASFTVVASILS
jgi:hypothetical protein